MSSEENTMIDISKNQLLTKFFEGWDRRKAQEFAQNLLLIGVGVAQKIVNQNDPEQAYEKIQKIACKIINVVKDYSNIEDGQQQNIRFKQVQQNEQINEGRSFNKRTAQFQDNRYQQIVNNNHTEEEIHNEIYKVQQKLQKLNQRLEQQTQQKISLENKSYQIPSKRKPLGSPEVTQKITQTSPPQLQLGSPERQGRQTQSFSGSRHHLNDEAIKECMNNPWDTENDEVGFGQPLTADNFQFTQQRDSNVNRSSERFSDTYFSTEFNFLNQPKQHHNQFRQEQVQDKKKKDERQSQKSLEYNTSQNQIKNNKVPNKAQQLKQQDSNRKRNPDDFKQISVQKKKNPSKVQDKMQIQPEQQNKKDKNDIINEMGVVFSKKAQRLFYEKKDQQMKLLEQQQQKRSSSEQLFQMQMRQQGNMLKNQQQKHNLGYPSQQYQNPEYYYSQEPQYQAYQMDKIRDNQVNVSKADVIRENQNNQLKYPMQYQQDEPLQGSKNILEIANDFLSSPFMKQFDEDNDGVRQQQNLEEYSQLQYEDIQQRNEQQNEQKRIQNVGYQLNNYQNQQYPLLVNQLNFQDGRNNNNNANEHLAQSQETTQNQFYQTDTTGQQQQYQQSQQQFPSFNPYAEYPRVESSNQKQSNNRNQQQQYYPYQDKIYVPPPVSSKSLIYQPQQQQYQLYSPDQQYHHRDIQLQPNKVDSKQGSGKQIQSPRQYQQQQPQQLSKAGIEGGYSKMNQQDEYDDNIQINQQLNTKQIQNAKDSLVLQKQKEVQFKGERN